MQTVLGCDGKGLYALIQKLRLQLVFFSDKQEVTPVCEDVFEVKNYPTTAFVFELAPETDVSHLARYGNSGHVQGHLKANKGAKGQERKKNRLQYFFDYPFLKHL